MAAVQDGGRERGHVGGAVQRRRHRKGRRAVRIWDAVPPGRLCRRLPRRPLQVIRADVVLREKLAAMSNDMTRNTKSYWMEQASSYYCWTIQAHVSGRLGKLSSSLNLGEPDKLSYLQVASPLMYVHGQASSSKHRTRQIKR